MINSLRAVCTVLVLLAGAALPHEASAQPEVPSQPAAAGGSDAAEQVPTLGQFLFGATAKTQNLQRTARFLDVDRIDKHLQVALLVDGTESMQQDIASLKEHLQAFLQCLANVRRDPVPTVEVAVIVYRDSGSPSGPVTLLVDRFESGIERVSEALQGLQPESGAPYFREALDQGLYSALSELDWRSPDEEGVSRWIIVASDAPPYPEGTDFRRHSDRELIDIARQKQIAVYGMALGAELVDARPGQERLRETAEQERPDLKTFLGRMAQATAGHAVDILDEASVRYWMTNRQVMPAITQTDIAARRLQRAAGNERPRIAVLPHLPLEGMQLDSEREEVQIATHLRLGLSRLGSVEVVSADAVRDAFATADRPSLPELGRALQADYLIWGQQKSDFDFLVIESGMYDADEGVRLAGVSRSFKPTGDPARLTILNEILRGLCEEGARELNMRGLMAHARALRAAWDDDRRSRELMQPLAKDQRAQSAILTGLEELEQALAYAQEDDPGRGAAAGQHLQAAIGHLEQALAIEPSNPYAHLLLADSCYNLGRTAAGDLDPRVQAHLMQAYDQADLLLAEDDPVRLEITAQHALLVTRDVETAVSHYRRLTGLNGRSGTATPPTEGAGDAAAAGALPTDPRFELRAHWMLAGIHLGEWDAISWGWDYVDPGQAREHILAILAFWPDSPEAAFYRDCIRRSPTGTLEVAVGDPQLAGAF